MPHPNIRDTAVQLHAYMTFRAAREGVGNTLTPSFYASALKKGCAGFFGVEISRGRLSRDSQRPDLFDEWSRPRGHA